MIDKNLYQRSYFEGGNKDGSGYKFIGYQNFPAQLVVLDKILERNPESLLDIGGARGYICKMFEQTTGKPAWCLDISEYCYSTRVTDKFILGDISDQSFDYMNTPVWPGSDDVPKIDLVFSIAVFEHIKEKDLPLVIERISRTAERGLICPSFYDVGEPDHTHESLHPKEWWQEMFTKHAPGWPVEIIDKEEMEKGDYKFTSKQINTRQREWIMAGRFVEEDINTMSGNNKRKIVLNIGSYVVMFRSTKDVCVINTDIPSISGNPGNGLYEFAKQWGYNFTTYKAPETLPINDGSIDEINCSHMLEHLTREEGKKFLNECHRVLKSGGSIRVTVPNLYLLCREYTKPCCEDNIGKIKRHGIYNQGVEKAEDDSQALWHMITSGGEHKTAYDGESLTNILKSAGFDPVYIAKFNSNTTEGSLILNKVGWDMYPESSLYVVGVK